MKAPGTTHTKMRTESKQITDFLETRKQVERAATVAGLTIAAIVLTTLIMLLW